MAAPVITGTAKEGLVLGITVGDWTNSPTSFSRQWMRCDAAGANAAIIPSATGVWYRPTAADVGGTIRCWVTSYNATGASSPVLTAQTAVVTAVAASVPANTTAPIITGSPVVGQLLTVSDGEWTNSPTRYEHCWDRCDAAGANCVDIANGQDCNSYNNTYLLTTADVGKTIKAYSTAANATGESTPVLSAATAVIQAAAPPTSPPGSLIFDGGFDTGNESQWSYIHRFAADRFRVTASADGVTPRGGGYMARIECRYNEPASWTAGRNISMAQKDGLQNVGLGKDTYTGWSVFLPTSYTPTYVNGDLYGNNIMEWHSNQPGSQAPFHFGVNGANSQYFIDLHTAATGWSPIFSKDCGAIKKGQWVDFVVRHKWRQDNTGIVQFWVNGSLVHTYNGRTWGTQSIVYPQFGLYRSNANFTNVLYIDALRVGTSYEVVNPASY